MLELRGGQFRDPELEILFRVDARARLYWVIIGPWLAGGGIVLAAIYLAYLRIGQESDYLVVAGTRILLVGAIFTWAWQARQKLHGLGYYLSGLCVLIGVMGYNLTAVHFGATDWVRISRSTIIELFLISLSLMALPREAFWAIGTVWVTHVCMGVFGVAVGTIQFINEMMVVSVSALIGIVLVWRFSHSERRAFLDRRSLQEARDKAQQEAMARASFLANMSHEIRTPLTGILGMLDITLDAKLPPQQQEELQETRACAQSLLTILNDVLDYSKIEAQGITLNPSVVQTAPLIKRIETLFRATARAKQIEIKSAINGVPEYLYIDDTRLGQVMSNLVGNAVKFTEHGSVELAANWQDEDEATGYLEIQVKDTGVGISTEAQTRLFSRFSQAEADTEKKFGGTGLGLSISKEIIAAMQGEIGVTSVPNRGSTFWFKIPCAKAEASQADAVTTDAPSTPKLKLLVADDNPVNRKIVAAYLHKAGHNTVLVEDGEQAVNALQQEPFDLVLMDVHMPNLGGVEALHQIRKLKPRAAKTPIIALTADSLESDKQALIQEGMDGYVAKPINPQELFSALASTYQARSLY